METPNNLRPAWQPGQSGNPTGRPKSRPLSNLLKAELLKPSRGTSGQTNGQKIVARLVGIALTGKRSESIQAMRLLFAYSDGLPDQTVEVDIYEAARELAQARGLDPDRVINLFETVKRRRAG